METKNQEKKVQRIQKRLRYKNSFVVNPEGIAGGLALFWDDQVELFMDSWSKSHINAQCVLKETQQQMHITFVHAPNVFQERVVLWGDLYRDSTRNHLPWLCLGDFNEILYHWEKAGKKRAETYRLTAFRDFLLQCSLMDLESKGCAFTLLKNEGDEWVKEEEPLKEITAAFFKNLYTSVGTRNFQPDPLCPICQKEAETIEHTLLLCPWTAIIWQDNSLVVYMARP